MTKLSAEHAPLSVGGVPSTVSPAGVSLRFADPRPLSEGDRVEWHNNGGTPSLLGTVTKVSPAGVYVKYDGGADWWHNLSHPKWSSLYRIVRTSDGVEF